MLPRVSVNEYHRLIDTGAFPDGSRIELVDGALVDMVPPHGLLHTSVMDALDVLFSRVDRRAFAVRCQLPLTLGDDGEPEPDWAIVARADVPRDAHPRTAALVVEVSDATVARDRAVKVPMYASHALPEVWIVDVRARAISVHRAPVLAERRYGDVRVARAAAVLAPLALPELAIAVSALVK